MRLLLPDSNLHPSPEIWVHSDCHMDILKKLLVRGKLLVTWAVAALAIVILGVLRHSTDTEYAFASVTIIPVFFVTWVCGFSHGVAAAALAVIMWAATDALSYQGPREIQIVYLNGSVRMATYCFVAYLTARIRTLLQREIELASHDALTGLMNRRAFLEAGHSEVGRALRYGHPVAIVFLDLDNFKQLNDSRGHDVGDTALKSVADALRKTLRTTDTVARLGGDEFGVVLPEIDCNAATEASNKIVAAVGTALTTFAPVTASVGVACFEKPDNDFARMLRLADKLMYEVKQDGKGGMRMRSFV